MQEPLFIKNENGSYFHFRCEGENKKGTIIFVHGFATTSEYHNVFIKHIINDYDYIAIQLPGAGFQEWKYDKKPTVEEMVLYCANLIRSLNLSKFILLGHSMGGGIVIRIANLFKKETIGLICSTPMNSGISFFKIFNYFKFNPKNFSKCFRLQNDLYYDLNKTMNNNQEQIEKMVVDELNYQLKHRKFFVQLKKSMFSIKNLKLCRANESKISCPTLVIAGKYDKIISPKSLFKAFDKKQRENYNLIRIELMNSSAHIPFQEQEYEYAKEIKDFINLITKEQG
ncbi:alpha/beta fold hydrolase [Mesomycoplasma moatsii]|uniref:alpha/beta fold hydrolase n=1 Tax=Mesomycoplasma moatsii TaxID=171287 RepID=UPI00040EB236